MNNANTITLETFRSFAQCTIRGGGGARVAHFAFDLYSGKCVEKKAPGLTRAG